MNEITFDVVGQGEEIICATRSRQGDVGIYRVDPSAKLLQLLAPLGADRADALRVGPNGLIWVALPGRIISLDPKTGHMETYD